MKNEILYSNKKRRLQIPLIDIMKVQILSFFMIFFSPASRVATARISVNCTSFLLRREAYIYEKEK